MVCERCVLWDNNCMEQFSPEIELPPHFFYHHARPIETIDRSKIARQVDPLTWATKEEYEYFEPFSRLYGAIKKVIGFYPVFMAVGPRKEDMQMTGIFRQKEQRFSPRGKEYVLFSFSGNNLRSPVFCDYAVWDGIWADFSLSPRTELTPKEIESLLKPEWKISDWMKLLAREPGSVQALVPQLDLARADRVCAPSERARETLVAMGFRGVELLSKQGKRRFI